MRLDLGASMLRLRIEQAEDAADAELAARREKLPKADFKRLKAKAVFLAYWRGKMSSRQMEVL